MSLIKNIPNTSLPFKIRHVFAHKEPAPYRTKVRYIICTLFCAYFVLLLCIFRFRHTVGFLILYPNENLEFCNVPFQYLHWT